jgi:hypothetical protein
MEKETEIEEFWNRIKEIIERGVNSSAIVYQD